MTNVTTNGKTVHNGWVGGGESGVYCGSYQWSNYKVTQFMATDQPVNCKKCLKQAGHKIAPAAPKAPKTPASDRCPGIAPTKGNPHALYRTCATCGKQVSWKKGKLRSHKA